MPFRHRPDLVFILILVFIVAACILLLTGIATDNATSQSLFAVSLGLLAVAGSATLLQWYNLKNKLIQPLRSVVRGAEIILKTHAAHELEIKPGHLLGRLPEIVHDFGDEIAESRSQISRALKTGAQSADDQRHYLEQVIRGLDEGVIVCDSQARIILYNPSAYRILQSPEQLGLGRSLFDVLLRGPVEHTLDVIRAQSTSDINGSSPTSKSTDFVCSVLNKEHMLHCRMGLLDDESDAVDSRGFVMTLSDVTARQGALRKRNELLRKTVEQLRSPLASLKAAAENINTHPDLPEEMRNAFNAVIVAESENLTEQIDHLAQESRKLLGGELVTADIFSTDLIHNIATREAVENTFAITQTGLPLWMRVDSHAMTVLIEFYMQQINTLQGVTSFDVDADKRDQKVYLDLTWQGTPVTHKQLNAWELETLPDVVGFPTVSRVLQQHSSVVWSQKHPRIDGSAILRIPVPGSNRPVESASETLPPRPMVYDFDLAQLAGDDATVKNQRLRELNFVVFDTETTGLNPDQGDEIIQIAGVRVVNQRILTDEVFDQLVYPNRSIPKSSIRFHGITDDDVQGKPLIDEVLPDFHRFVGNSVLVAHNAWFDLKFLKRREMQSGIRFRNPVLDTLMLSVCLHGHEVDQSLDAIVARLGIEILERHTALADSLATAELLLRLIDLLEAQGIITLQDALNAYK
ncbi:MAG TPA: histidine kinase [Gammaproteobacteria bacterium]|jgi:DNA polymerase-3 subunit epsilon|nr:histidine kinase [Gammaproteobacteria bacterium]